MTDATESRVEPFFCSWEYLRRRQRRRPPLESVTPGDAASILPVAMTDAEREADAAFSVQWFAGYSPEERVEKLMKAGRISVEAMPYVLAHLKAVAGEAARAAAKAEREEGNKVLDLLRATLHELQDTINERDARLRLLERTLGTLSPKSSQKRPRIKSAT